MILIGQYDSSFVRRIGIALKLYGVPFEHRPWSTFGDADKIRPYNPLTRVPTLVLPDGDVLTDSHVIIDFVDSLAAPAERLYPTAQPARHRAMAIAALGTGLADKAVALFYEQRLHDQRSDMWATRCRTQLASTLRVLETDSATRSTSYWFGEQIGHADIAVACALRHMNDAHPGLIDMANFPTLRDRAERLEALPVFIEISQPFIAPASS